MKVVNEQSVSVVWVTAVVVWSSNLSSNVRISAFEPEINDASDVGDGGEKKWRRVSHACTRIRREGRLIQRHQNNILNAGWAWIWCTSGRLESFNAFL